MEELLAELVDKKLDIVCGPSTSFRGQNLGVKNGVLQLKDDNDRVYFIAVTGIVAYSEVGEHLSRPGFIG